MLFTNTCTQKVIRYFIAKRKILKLYPNNYFEFFTTKQKILQNAP